MRAVRRGLRAFGVAIALLLVLRAVAQAHAMLVGAEPAANAHLNSGPARVRLVFSEEIDPTLARLSLIASDGTARQLAVRGDPHDVRALIGTVEQLAAGAYRVRWRVVSADGHPVEGSYAFWVGAGSQAAPPLTADTTTAASPVWGPSIVGAPVVPAVLRGAALALLMALTGLLGFATLGSPTPLRDHAGAARVRRAIAWLSVSTAVLFVLHFVAWLLNASATHRLGGEETTTLLRSGVARVEEWRVGLAALSLWASALARRPRLAFAFAVTALVVSGWAGHSAAMYPVVAIPAKSLHLLAGAAWLGGLTWLVTVTRDDSITMRREALRVSVVALWAVVFVAVSGTVQAIAFLPSVRAVFTSAYGAITIAKAVGLCVLVGFGAYHRSRSLPRISTGVGTPAIDAFRRALRVEVVVMVLVILLGGWLAYVSPPPPSMASHATLTHS
ncbi:MAG TPA: copper resistance protein CopC [Gemmatimonadaceae bacterium]|jgi:copper transport protein|nr:copper resistance protein CopC [Gemmatimonadaceae bacterium]